MDRNPQVAGQMGEAESIAPMSPATGRVRTMAAPLDADQVLERVPKDLAFAAQQSARSIQASSGP